MTVNRSLARCSIARKPPSGAHSVAARVVALVLALLAAAQLSLASPARADTPVRFGEGLYFKLEKPGVAPSWLYGTIHIGAPCDAFPRQKVIERVRSVRLLMMELVIDPPTTARLRAAAALPENQNLSDFVRRPDFERLAAIYGEAGVPRNRLERFQVWAASNGLVHLARPGGRAVDAELADIARRAARTTVALETVDEQLAFLAHFPPDEQLEMLRYGIEHFAKLPRLLGLMLEVWRAEDGTMLRRISEGRHPDVPTGSALYQAALRRKLTMSAERDRRMTDRAIPELERGGVLIAVGALHLSGDTAIPALLAGRGFSVTREEVGPLELPAQCSQPQQPAAPAPPAPPAATPR